MRHESYGRRTTDVGVCSQPKYTLREKESRWHTQEDKLEQTKNVIANSVYDYTFKERGNGVLNEDRVPRFSATTLPFPASENADVRWFPHVSFFTCTHL
jgi:hypothetical protein